MKNTNAKKLLLIVLASLLPGPLVLHCMGATTPKSFPGLLGLLPIDLQQTIIFYSEVFQVSSFLFFKTSSDKFVKS